MTRTEHVIADLQWVSAYWPDLTEARLPGTARPWRQPELSPEQRAERDHLARIEKAERNGSALGESPTPVDVGILDLLASLLCDADTIHDHVSRWSGVERLDPPSSAFADARPYLTYAVKHLPAVPGDHPDHHDIASLARAMVGQIARALCLVYDGQRLDVVCPWCHGGLTGGKTWRVRQLPGDLVAIVCEADLCEPPGKDVGTWWRGRPCWPVAEWDWLAKRVTVAETRSDVA